MSYRYEEAMVGLERLLVKLPQEGKLPSIRSLMAQLGVSQVTVDRCIAELVKQGRLRHEQRRGYFASMPRPTGKVIGLYVTLRNSPLVNTLFAQGTRQAAAAHGYEVADFGSRSFLERIDERLGAIDPLSLAGLIICPTSAEISSLMGDPARIERLRHMPLPVVVTHQAGGMFIDGVTADDFQTMEKVGQRLRRESPGPYIFLGRNGIFTMTRMHGLEAGLGEGADLRAQIVVHPRLMLKDQIQHLRKVAGGCSLIVGAPLDDISEYECLSHGPWKAGTAQSLVVLLEHGQKLPAEVQAHQVIKPTMELGEAATELLVNRLTHPQQPWQHRVLTHKIKWATGPH